MTMRALIAAVAFSGLAALVGVAAGQVVVLPDLGNTRLTGISDDGLRVTGSVSDRLPYANFFWSAAAGYEFPSHPNLGGTALISGNGDWLAGASGLGEQQTYLATSDGTTTLLPFSIPGQVNQSLATGISRDGSVVCGWDTHRSNSIEVGWRWSAVGGMQVLPGFQAATAMSGDGSTVFGNTGGGGHVMWRNGVTTQLPPGGEIAAVNFDGSIYAGRGGPTGLGIWNNNVLTSVSYLPGFGVGQFYDINEDGTVAVGWNGSSLTPFVWTPSTGTQPLGAYFASFGYDLSAYRFTNVHVSADGRTFGLTALDATSARGIIVTVPSPGALFLLAGFAFHWRRRAWRVT